MNNRPFRNASRWQFYSCFFVTLAGLVSSIGAQEQVVTTAVTIDGLSRTQAIAGDSVLAARQASMDFSSLVQAEKASPSKPVKKSKPVSQSLQDHRGATVPSGAPVGRQKFQAKPYSALSNASVSSGSTGAIAKAGTALPPSPLPSASFQALLGPSTSAINPDTQGAVGPNHLMTTLNTSVLVQDRNGGTVSSVTIEAFWASVGASNIFDPRVLYDPYGQRWITTAEADPGGANPGLVVGVSKTSNPTQGWNLYFIDVDTVAPRYADSPNVGFNKDFIVVQANMYNATNSNFASSDIYVFNKTNLYAGGIAASTRFSSDYDSQVPAVVYDPDLPEVYVAYNYSGSVLETDVDTGVTSHYGELYLWSINATNGGAPVMTFATIVYSCQECTWADFTAQSNFAPQLGSTNKIYTGDSRLQNLVFREGTYYTTHTVFSPTNNPSIALVQWWQFTPSDPVTGSQVITQDRIADTTGGFFAFPSIAVNRYSQYVIGYTRFSATSYPSANYTYITSDDFPRADTVLKSGEGPYRKLDSSSLNLWGDWSATVVDPINDTDFWTLQEYSARNGVVTNIWGTWWGRISPPTELSIGIADSPDPILAGANLTYSIAVTN
ncbi:MAG: hypothetical protein JWM16_6155, partial [Verrucomicrobiales bacterium]|nr:hypothetical protein [Verrucomicrobiales bacterium]